MGAAARNAQVSKALYCSAPAGMATRKRLAAGAESNQPAIASQPTSGEKSGTPAGSAAAKASPVEKHVVAIAGSRPKPQLRRISNQGIERKRPGYQHNDREPNGALLGAAEGCPGYPRYRTRNGRLQASARGTGGPAATPLGHP